MSDDGVVCVERDLSSLPYFAKIPNLPKVRAFTEPSRAEGLCVSGNTERQAASRFALVGGAMVPPVSAAHAEPYNGRHVFHCAITRCGRFNRAQHPPAGLRRP